jgi:hypothetical protein
MSEEGFIQCQSPRVQVSMTRGRECEVLRGEKRNKFNQAKVSDWRHTEKICVFQSVVLARF